MDPATEDAATEDLAPGTVVEVQRRFDHGWARGFSVEHIDDDGYTVRRDSDGAILPVTFPAAEVRLPGRNGGGRNVR